MNSLARFMAITMSSLLLAACATTRTSQTLPPPLTDAGAIRSAENAQTKRAGWLQAHQQWSFTGRVAINNAGKGGNGKIDWEQDGRGYVVALSAPVTRQSWRLIGDTHSEAGRLEGLDGGPREGEDAEALLLQATGWEIPVNALTRWVQGLPAEGLPAETQSFSAQGRLQTLEQAGWRIDYTEWFEAAGDQPALPRRIEARRDRAMVRLIIDRWDLTLQ